MIGTPASAHFSSCRHRPGVIFGAAKPCGNCNMVSNAFPTRFEIVRDLPRDRG
jgi:hypothetical protein